MWPFSRTLRGEQHVDHCFPGLWWKIISKTEVYIWSAHSTVRRQCGWRGGSLREDHKPSPATPKPLAFPYVRKKPIPRGLKEHITNSKGSAFQMLSKWCFLTITRPASVLPRTHHHSLLNRFLLLPFDLLTYLSKDNCDDNFRTYRVHESLFKSFYQFLLQYCSLQGLPQASICLDLFPVFKIFINFRLVHKVTDFIITWSYRSLCFVAICLPLPLFFLIPGVPFWWFLSFPEIVPHSAFISHIFHCSLYLPHPLRSKFLPSNNTFLLLWCMCAYTPQKHTYLYIPTTERNTYLHTYTYRWF